MTHTELNTRSVMQPRNTGHIFLPTLLSLVNCFVPVSECFSFPQNEQNTFSTVDLPLKEQKVLQKAEAEIFMCEEKRCHQLYLSDRHKQEGRKSIWLPAVFLELQPFSSTYLIH